MMSDELTERRLTDEEAEQLYDLLGRINEEMKAQLLEQGLSNEPISYTTIVRGRKRRYLEERYGVSDD